MVVPDMPHHVTQRRNQRMQTSCCNHDYPAYIELMPHWCAHICMGKDDALVQVQPMLDQVGDWAGYLALDVDEAEAAVMRRHERTGNPRADAAFIAGLESHLARFLTKCKPGPKRKKNAN